MVDSSKNYLSLSDCPDFSHQPIPLTSFRGERRAKEVTSEYVSIHDNAKGKQGKFFIWGWILYLMTRKGSILKA
jgi:hypothetical protein